MGRRRGILALAIVLLAGGGGCVPAPVAPPVAPGLRLDLVDHAELMQRVRAHEGKVVVLDCWSTSCPPCIREFPGLVRLAAAHPQAVACLSLSFDYEGIGSPEAAATRVREFLASVHATRIENLLSREEADVMYRKLELDSVPAVYVWRPDGSLARRFDDDDAKRRLGRPFTYADVEAEVRGLLAE
jgi:thiol-disulfide isomerase/thioredoxin